MRCCTWAIQLCGLFSECQMMRRADDVSFCGPRVWTLKSLRGARVTRSDIMVAHRNKLQTAHRVCVCHSHTLSYHWRNMWNTSLYTTDIQSDSFTSLWLVITLNERARCAVRNSPRAHCRARSQLAVWLRWNQKTLSVQIFAGWILNKDSEPWVACVNQEVQGSAVMEHIHKT